MEILQRRRRAERVRTGPPAGLLARWGLRGARALVAEPPEAQEQANADRGARLAAFIAGEPVPNVWGDDLEPKLFEFHDSILLNILELDETEPGATEKLWGLVGQLRGLGKWANSIDGAIQLGTGAQARIALRQMRQAVAADTATKEA